LLNQILFAFEQYRLLIIFIHFQQREQTALIVNIGQSRRITDNALATRHTPALAKPADTVLVGIIAAAPDQLQDALQKQSRFHSPKNFSPYIGLTGRPAAAAALQEIQGLGGSFFLNLLFM